MRVHVDAARTLRFDDGTPVTAASGVVPLGDGWLVVQDDSTIAAWRRPDRVTALRVLPPVEGVDMFRSAAGTKHLKPDLEVACPAEVDGGPAALLLGSGSSPRRMRGVLVRLEDGKPVVDAAELGPLYERVAEPGAFLLVPRGAVHGLRRLSDETVRMVTVVSPAGMERFFEAVVQHGEEELLADPERLVALAEEHGTRMVGDYPS